uniref:SbsA Ig-like domain-containing protein n=1 Tax=Candidatus Methanogaster sp. ANME-2c ERB4 TaxID=2759911 RepID=A0A7G9YNP9_9EURY|nr:hypothetical protein AIHMFPNM_00036 [Methanosarcinales archaeon ANME-2c ERB4]
MTLVEGEPRDLGAGYLITATKIDLRRDEATFELIKDGARIDSATVKNDERFRLEYSEENFYFEATRGDISTYTDTIATLTHSTFRSRVHLTGYESGYDSNTRSASTADTTPPTVTEKSPTGENVPVATRIVITFSEPMNKESAQYAFHILDSMQ